MLIFTYFEHGGHGLVTKIKPLGGTEISFGYDALLRRVRMTQGAVSTYFRHDGIDLLEVADTAGNLTKLTHGYKTIAGIGSVVEIEKNGTRYYLHQDHRGTTYKITDANGDVVWTGLCDAWGNVISETGSNPSIFWYQGEAWWKLTVNGRLCYISPTRIYDVTDGRFLERDPWGTPTFENHPFYGRGNTKDDQGGLDSIHWLRRHNTAFSRVGPFWDMTVTNQTDYDFHGRKNSINEKHAVLDGLHLSPPYDYVSDRLMRAVDPSGAVVPVIVGAIVLTIRVVIIIKGITNLICAIYGAWECGKCKKRTEETVDLAARLFDDPGKLALMLQSSKPGIECAEVCGEALRDFFKGMKWLVGGYLIKYLINPLK